MIIIMTIAAAIALILMTDAYAAHKKETSFLKDDSNHWYEQATKSGLENLKLKEELKQAKNIIAQLKANDAPEGSVKRRITDKEKRAMKRQRKAGWSLRRIADKHNTTITTVRKYASH